MRFIGNKESITNEIIKLLKDKNLMNKNYRFFDAFVGTGSVANAVKKNFKIIINDKLKWCTVYSKGRIKYSDFQFIKLGFNPFYYLNNSETIVKGFFYKNYSPAGSDRMYFTPHNAGRIDYFRNKIEDWKSLKKITDSEYIFLLASLIESISKVANVAGVYGAFLKKWDNRAKNKIEFIPVGGEDNESYSDDVKVYNDNIEDIISKVDCDVLYLDPPYTQNQYGTQYHLLETLVLYDNPKISKITGSRPTGPMRSDWSKNYKAHILFDKLVAETKAKYIVFSYSTDGIMSKSFIESVMKRYAKKGTYECRKISYKKYRNWKTRTTKEHFEYLFFMEKADKDQLTIESPLNYIGNKSRLIHEIKKYLPVLDKESTFYDIFGGGFNVGINIDTQKIVFNDINGFVVDLIQSFKKYDTYQYIQYVKKSIRKYDLKPKSKEGYLKIRSYYNSLDLKDRDPRLLYTMILYGFNQQIRFNSDFNFNNPVGMRWFNDKVLEKLISFSRVIKSKNVDFYNQDFTKLSKYIKHNDFVYMDPPYMLTTGSYNDGKRGFSGWSVEHEDQLFKFADNLNSRNVKFMISYVLEHNGKINQHLQNWLSNRNYNLIKLSNIVGKKRKEIIIINYDCSN